MTYFNRKMDPRPHKDASMCRCSCHSNIGRSVHITACCIGGWVLPMGYRAEPADATAKSIKPRKGEVVLR